MYLYPVLEIEKLYLLVAHRLPVIDSRKVVEGCVFFALKGNKVDGHDFILAALTQGAEIAIADHPDWKHHEGVFWVPDVTEALQGLARKHRIEWGKPIIAVAGSNGKTTTKELLSAVLGTKFHVFATPGNLNNHLGVPLSLLQLRPEHDMAVIELGANHAGETAFLADLVAPNFGLVTNNGKDHLEGFGSVEGVRKANAELYEYFRQHAGSVFVSSRQHDLMEDSLGLSRQTFGTFTADDFTYVPASGRTAGIEVRNTKIVSKLAGGFNEENIAAAVCVGQHFGVSLEEASRGIQSYVPSLLRSQEMEWKGLHLRVDAYNANPSSMVASLLAFVKETPEPRCVVLADMLEMGVFAKEEHASIVALLGTLPLEEVWLVGPCFQEAAAHTSFRTFTSTDALRHSGGLNWPAGTHVLLKGSRGFQLEKLIQ